MSVVDNLSEQALALASQQDDDAAVAGLARIAGGDRAALDRAADTLLNQAPNVDPSSLNLRARAIGLLTRPCTATPSADNQDRDRDLAPPATAA